MRDAEHSPVAREVPRAHVRTTAGTEAAVLELEPGREADILAPQIVAVAVHPYLPQAQLPSLIRRQRATAHCFPPHNPTQVSWQVVATVVEAPEARREDS